MGVYDNAKTTSPTINSTTTAVAKNRSTAKSPIWCGLNPHHDDHGKSICSFDRDGSATTPTQQQARTQIMLSSQIDEHERREVLRNDARVKQGTTMHAFSEADAAIAQGRFTQVSAATVVGSTPNPASAYPACSPALAVKLPDEEPLGYRIDAMPEREILEPFPAQGNSGDAAIAPSTNPTAPGLMSERAASPPLSRTFRRF
jgi:hypothetical protein